MLGELQASRQGVAIPQVAAVAGEGGVDRDDELVEQVVLDEDRVSVMPPTEMSPPSVCLRARMASMGSPVSSSEFCYSSGPVSVVDTTYFLSGLTKTPNSSVASGQYSAHSV